MSRDFKSKFGQMQENHSDQTMNDDSDRLYGTDGNVRNLIFAWPSGKLQSFNYAYLVTHEIDPDENLIRMEFTTHEVVIRGYGLEKLFLEIFEQRRRIVECIDARYNDTIKNDLIVNEILVTEH